MTSFQESAIDPLKKQTESMKENDVIENAEVPNNSNNIKFQFSSQQQILANPKLSYSSYNKKFIFSLKTEKLEQQPKKKENRGLPASKLLMPGIE